MKKITNKRYEQLLKFEAEANGESDPFDLGDQDEWFDDRFSSFMVCLGYGYHGEGFLIGSDNLDHILDAAKHQQNQISDRLCEENRVPDRLSAILDSSNKRRITLLRDAAVRNEVIEVLTDFRSDRYLRTGR